MEEVLKGLQGKTLTKKKLFDFLADIDLEGFIPKKELDVIEPIEVKTDIIQCVACMNTFTTTSSLKRHHIRNPVCLTWIDLPQKPEISELSRGLHLIVDTVLKKAMSGDNNLECKYCNLIFTNTGNHHKHYNKATVCNRLAFQEFKQLLNKL